MAEDDDIGRAPNPVDRHVGLRIRLRRKELGVSQERLAESIGLTFQQVQKYERAANRVSASKLWQVAHALQTSVAYFYEGLAEPTASGQNKPASPSVQDFLMTPEGYQLASLFPRIRRPRLRKRVVELVRSMVEEEDEADG
jgi:transcriptional regulator with XRE-family HTH domain